MTTRDGHKWLVLRSETGGSYVAARSDSDFAKKHEYIYFVVFPLFGYH
jgi:hypothetical protein